MEGPAEKKSRTDEGENTAVVLYGVDDLRIVIYCYVRSYHVVYQLCARSPLDSLFPYLGWSITSANYFCLAFLSESIIKIVTLS